ncbi:DgyrCDS11053 [Dimorphilus gyrociliatus]|uniref:DgyrCDS11053 n=1 Tax=Dimorphilus gyrociliatus TaxID=2664684 RepID=A0A7I8W382_9ANNE|nr:DgyrCDS11053 [Dimorphilus gyrociliatus]
MSLSPSTVSAPNKTLRVTRNEKSDTVIHSSSVKQTEKLVIDNGRVKSAPFVIRKAKKMPPNSLGKMKVNRNYSRHNSQQASPKDFLFVSKLEKNYFSDSEVYKEKIKRNKYPKSKDEDIERREMDDKLLPLLNTNKTTADSRRNDNILKSTTEKLQSIEQKLNVSKISSVEILSKILGALQFQSPTKSARVYRFRKERSFIIQMPNGDFYEVANSPDKRGGESPLSTTKNGQLSRSGSLTVLKRPTSSQSSDRPLSRHGSKASTQFSLESNSYSSVDLGNEKLPDINTAEASRVCSVRLRHIIKKIEKDDISREDLIKNLAYAASVLEATYIDETKKRKNPTQSLTSSIRNDDLR